MAYQRSRPSLKLAIILGLAACTSLSACNKLGYGEPRTAPEGNAILGAKRMPQMNQAEIQKQRMFQGQSNQQSMQQNPRPPAMPVAMMPSQQIAPQSPAPMSQAMQQQQQPMQQQYSPQIPSNYPVTPYSASPQNYNMPTGNKQPVAQPQPQQSSYNMPYQYAPGSYYPAPNPVAYNNNNLAQTVSLKDYYAQDIQQMPSSSIVEQGQWYAPSAPVGQVVGSQLPTIAPSAYNAGYGMDAAYGRYQEPSLAATANRTPSNYQPMTAKQASAYPSIDPYAQEMNTPEYNNIYYGGNGGMMPQQSSRNFAPDFDAAASGQAFTSDFEGRASGMLNPVSSTSYADTQMRHPLEEPPMLGQETALPNPNSNSAVYYGDGGYR